MFHIAILTKIYVLPISACRVDDESMFYVDLPKNVDSPSTLLISASLSSVSKLGPSYAIPTTSYSRVAQSTATTTTSCSIVALSTATTSSYSGVAMSTATTTLVCSKAAMFPSTQTLPTSTSTTFSRNFQHLFQLLHDKRFHWKCSFPMNLSIHRLVWHNSYKVGKLHINVPIWALFQTKKSLYYYFHIAHTTLLIEILRNVHYSNLIIFSLRARAKKWLIWIETFEGHRD